LCSPNEHFSVRLNDTSKLCAKNKRLFTRDIFQSEKSPHSCQLRECWHAFIQHDEGYGITNQEDLYIREFERISLNQIQNF
jgi:hypothetical protein